jgi:hypothetical protein
MTDPSELWLERGGGAGVTYLEAAITVLRDSRRPMTAREITEETLRRGLLKSVGRTPEATMSAALYIYVQRDGEKQIRRVFEPGEQRAVRGSVRWELTGA